MKDLTIRSEDIVFDKVGTEAGYQFIGSKQTFMLAFAVLSKHLDEARMTTFNKLLNDLLVAPPEEGGDVPTHAAFVAAVQHWNEAAAAYNKPRKGKGFKS